MQWQNYRKTLVLASAIAITVIASFNAPIIKKGINRLITGKHFNVGIASLLNSEYEQAAKSFTKVLSRDPNFALAYEKRGLAYLELGQYDSALQDYKRVIQSQNPDTELLQQIGRTHLNLKDYSEATRFYTKAIDTNPKLSNAYIGRGVAYYKQQKYWNALDDFNQVLEINAKSIQAYLGRGLIYAQLSGFEKSTEEYVQALMLANNEHLKIEPDELVPDSQITYLSLGMARYTKDNKTGAIAELEKSLELDPTYIQAYLLKGIIFFEQEKYELALTVLEQAREHLIENEAGFGMSLDLDEENQLPVIKQVFESFSAQQQGLKAGDKILVIDGKPVPSMPLIEVVELLRGPQNTTAILKIQREHEEPFEVSLTRNFSLTDSLLASILASQALANEGLQNHEIALEDCEKVKIIATANTFAHQSCGAIYQDNNNIQAAKASYQRALKLYIEEQDQTSSDFIRQVLDNLNQTTND